MKRAKQRGLKRNAAVVLGNVGPPDDIDVLTRALDDPEPLVREHAAWALARLGALLRARVGNYSLENTTRTPRRPSAWGRSAWSSTRPRRVYEYDELNVA